MPTKPMFDRYHLTRLETYIREWGVTIGVFARRAGISHTGLLRLRRGETEPSRRTMMALADAASEMREKPVYIVELFELSPADEAIYLALLERRNEP
ncbi:MAG TPA: helix-turn-helix transcriptional regulator [Thermoanaerobaculia bacterium]|jgi:transcriptional regulator with XRE-family HTH domain|nr:helix-turn-helix transcriptional regulator [Thermoanaerobaculia bacterium]